MLGFLGNKFLKSTSPAEGILGNVPVLPVDDELAERMPLAEAAFADFGCARGGGDGARSEHGRDGAFLRGSQAVSSRSFDELSAAELFDIDFFIMRNLPRIYASRPARRFCGARPLNAWFCWK